MAEKCAERADNRAAARNHSVLRLVESPTALQAKLLGDLTVEDGGIYPLAAPRSMGYYLTHPAAAGCDLGTARWKIGFLKRLAPLPLPYGKIYQKLKK